MRRLAIGTLAGLSIFACVQTDYLYRHEVRGRVLGPGGVPVSGATVMRAVGESGEQQYGLADLYRRTTAEDGSFAFVYQGLGPEPEPAHVWFLSVYAEGMRGEVKKIEVRWRDGAQPEQMGYIETGIELRLEAEH
ncbi:MAG: carboxypeptidase regulatory-like domain-containing protein [Deltaproteobacteria bacterium]|nr:carboxypeptidase regulatory-like domain-containing protein [Deltaproteobacteria bacterium]